MLAAYGTRRFKAVRRPGLYGCGVGSVESNFLIFLEMVLYQDEEISLPNCVPWQNIWTRCSIPLFLLQCHSAKPMDKMPIYLWRIVILANLNMASSFSASQLTECRYFFDVYV